jgi:hypothetical protein
MNLRQLCAVESAARAHPGNKVTVALFNNIQGDTTHATQKILDEYKNIRMGRVDLRTWLHGTPVSPETFHGRRLFEKLRRSAYKVQLTLNFLLPMANCFLGVTAIFY